MSMIGSFVEKDYRKWFEFSVNNDKEPFAKDFPHKIWVTNPVEGIDHGFRYGTVKKTVAYLAVDEDSDGNPIIEKWYITEMNRYS